MARNSSTVEVNKFVKGIITEASPLTYPENASIDERNFVLNNDGSRKRRLGFDMEENYNLLLIDSYEESDNFAFASHSWEDLGQRSAVKLVVIQVGKRLDFFDISESPLSNNRIFNYTIDGAHPNEKMSFAVVDKRLVVASGDENIHVFSYENGSVTVNTERLKIRDLFGVYDPYKVADPDPVDMRLDNNIDFRPEIELSDRHLYNLRNQTWGHMVRIVSKEYKEDPIAYFNGETGAKRFPSNADSLLTGLAPLPDDADDRVGERFHPKAVVNHPVAINSAPKGFFIIDALNRGESRIKEVGDFEDKQDGVGQDGANPVTYRVGSLPTDKTEDGAKVVASYGGRAFYAGFGNTVRGGDRHSPSMGSMVLFSQLIKDPNDFTKCYQDGDPTSNEAPDLLDTDGGFLTISGAKNIKQMIEFDRYLVVFADNGVWTITGGADYGFTATDYRVDKVSSFGLAGPDTAVVAGNILFYWSHDGIYAIQGDQTGKLQSKNLTINTIQSLFDQTTTRQRSLCKGVYETSKARVRWLLYNWDESFNITRFFEVIYDTLLQAFYINEVDTVIGLQTAGVGSVETTSSGDLEAEVTTASGDTETVILTPSDVRPWVDLEVFTDSGEIILPEDVGFYVSLVWSGQGLSGADANAINDKENWTILRADSAIVHGPPNIAREQNLIPQDGRAAFRITVNWPSPIETTFADPQTLSFYGLDPDDNFSFYEKYDLGVSEGDTSATVEGEVTFTNTNRFQINLGGTSTDPDPDSISGHHFIAFGDPTP